MANKADQDVLNAVQSPDEIHKVLRIMKKGSWRSTIVLCSLAALTLAFLLFGKIPMTGAGNAMLVVRETVRNLEVTADGQIARLGSGVEIGAHIEVGQVLVELSQPLIVQQLEQAKSNLALTVERNKETERLSAAANTIERSILERKSETLATRVKENRRQIDEARKLTEENYAKKRKVLDERARDFGALRVQEKRKLEDVEAKLERTLASRKKRLATQDQVIQAQQAVASQRLRLRDLDLRVLELGLERTKSDQTYLDSVNRLATREDSLARLQNDLSQQQLSLAQLEQREATDRAQRRLEVEDLKRTIARHYELLEKDRYVRSEYSGTLLELTAGVGEVVSRGFRLGSVDTSGRSAKVEAVAYFKLADGKRIKPGMTIRITPATVEQTRFGAVLATVQSVSKYAVTVEGATNVVGNETIATELTSQGYQIQVVCELQTDDEGKPAWDLSSGPKFDLTRGTKAKALVHLKERPPLTFIIPILQDWKGFEFSP